MQEKEGAKETHETLTNERIDLTKFLLRELLPGLKCHHDLLSIAVVGALKDITSKDHLLTASLRDRLKALAAVPQSPFPVLVCHGPPRPDDGRGRVYKKLSASIALL